MKIGIKVVAIVMSFVLVAQTVASEARASGGSVSCLAPVSRVEEVEEVLQLCSGRVPEEYNLLQEGRAVFGDEGEFFSLSEQTIKDMLIFEPRIGLFDYVDETITDWGEKRLRWLLTHPYLDPNEILARQEVISFFMNNPRLLRRIRKVLAKISMLDSFLESFFSEKPVRFSRRERIKRGFLIGWSFKRKIRLLRGCIRSLSRGSERGRSFLEVIDEFLKKPVEARELCRLLGVIAEVDVSASLAQAGLRHAVSNNIDPVTKSIKDKEIEGAVTMPRILKQENPLFQMKQGIIPAHIKRQVFYIGRKQEKQVANDFELASDKSFAIVRGENASGKTMLLRTIGRIAILSQIGSPVPAGSVAITPMAIHSMVNISDDPSTGRSYTEVEVDELSQILRKAEDSCKQLFLFDEMLKGMCLTAREKAEPMSAKLLLDCGGLTVLTTHSNFLEEFEEGNDNKVVNYHMGSTESAEEKYKIMRGKIRWSNALRILREMEWDGWWREDIREIGRLITEAGMTGIEETDTPVNLESGQIAGSDRFEVTDKSVERWKKLNKKDERRFEKIIIKIFNTLSRDAATWMVFGAFYTGIWTTIRSLFEFNIPLLDSSILGLLFMTVVIIIIGIFIITFPKPILRTRQKYVLERILGIKHVSEDVREADFMKKIPEYLESELRMYSRTEKRPEDEIQDGFERKGDTYGLNESEISDLRLVNGKDSIFSTINNTRTVWGERRLRWLLENPYHSAHRIKDRQEIVKSLYKNESNGSELKKILEDLRDSWQRNMYADLKKKVRDMFYLCLSIFFASSGIFASAFALFGMEAGFVILLLGGFVVLGILVYGLFYKKILIKEYTMNYIRDVLAAIDRIKPLLERLSLDDNREVRQLLDDLIKTKEVFVDLKYEIIEMIFPPRDFDTGYKPPSKYGDPLARTLSVIGELDVYLSLAEIPQRYPHWQTMPEVVWSDQGVPVLDIVDGHNPLIPIERSQPNSILINRENKVLIIGGSHGEGKSTFLRTINQLGILGSIGSFVPAGQMRFTPAKLMVCINLEDSPELGLSTFQAFADFLKRFYARWRSGWFSKNYLVTFDEFTEGTNPEEARIIGKVIIQRFVELGIPMAAVVQDAELLKQVAGIKGVAIAHPERIGGKVTYRITEGIPDELAVLEKLLQRPLHPSLRSALEETVRKQREGSAGVVSRDPADVIGASV